MTTAQQRRELIELWLLAAESAATDAQLARLSQRIDEDGDARAALIQLTRHQGWLAWNASSVRLPAAYAALAPASFEEQPAATSVAGGSSRRRRAGAGTARLARWISGAAAAGRSTWRRVAASRWSMGGVAVGLAIACMAGYLAGQWVAPARPLAKAEADPATPAIHATMVSSTGCIWGPGNTMSAMHSGAFAGGDSLRLLEGIAELRVRYGVAADARIQLEGPASVVLTAQGTPSISYGKVVVATEGSAGSVYEIEIPFGRIFAEAETEIGVIAFGSTAEIHCLRGRVTVESPWFVSAGEEIASKTIAAGEALLLDNVGDMTLRVATGPANRGRFTPQVSMQADFLSVGREYVDEIRRAAPLAFWRFEKGDRPPGDDAVEQAAPGGIPSAVDGQGVVRNWMGDRFHGRLKGKVRWVGPEGNQCIEFGVTPEPGSLIVDEPWDEVLDGDFALEAWIKPSHFQLGSVIGFIGEFDWQDRRNKHGVLLEVNGTSLPSGIHQPERIRFLHRSTLGVQGGVSCFSDSSYQARRWQHVVAVKEGVQLRLYLDGRLVAEAEDAAPTPRGLQLVMGQLYTETVERFFIGHVDEVAIYDRALDASEVGRHYELLRPAARPGLNTL